MLGASDSVRPPGAKPNVSLPVVPGGEGIDSEVDRGVRRVLQIDTSPVECSG